MSEQPDDLCRCAHRREHHWRDEPHGCFARDVIGVYIEACPCGRFIRRAAAQPPEEV